MTWWIIATLLAFFIKGVCGFANTLVFTTIISFTTNNVNISPVELVLGYPTNLIMAWKERKSIKWSISISIAILLIAGSIPGMLLLKNADADIIKMIFGILTILLSLEMLLRELQKKKVKDSKLVLGIIGVLAGVFCGLYGIGALLGAYMNRVTDDSSSFKANFCTVFVIENTFRIIMYGILGIITFDVCKQAVILMPLMIVSLLFGMYCSKKLKEDTIKKVVICMLFISGIALIVNNNLAFLCLLM